MTKNGKYVHHSGSVEKRRPWLLFIILPAGTTVVVVAAATSSHCSQPAPGFFKHCMTEWLNALQVAEPYMAV